MGDLEARSLGLEDLLAHLGVRLHRGGVECAFARLACFHLHRPGKFLRQLWCVR